MELVRGAELGLLNLVKSMFERKLLGICHRLAAVFYFFHKGTDMELAGSTT